MSTTGKGNIMAKTFDDAVKPGRIAFEQPFNEAYGIIGRGRRVKIVPDDNRVHCCRKEFENVNKRLCIENALKWVNA